MIGVRHFWVRFAQVGMVGGPVALVIANLAGANQTGTDEQTLVWAAAHRSAYLATSVLVLVGFGLLTVSGAWLAASLTDRGAALGVVGGSCYVTGAFATVVTNSVYLLSARLITLPGMDRTAALMIKSAGDEDGGVGLFVLLTPLLEVGIVVLAIGLVRERLVPLAGAALLAAGALAAGVTEVVGASTVVLVLALVVLLAGFVITAVYSNRWATQAPARGDDRVAVLARRRGRGGH